MKSSIYTFFVAGIVSGLAAALLGLMGTGSRALPDGAVAQVNDSYTTRAAFERALTALEIDKLGALTDANRQQVINRLIDEESLIQYGVRQGFIRSDKRAKSILVQSVIEAKNLLAKSREITTTVLAGLGTFFVCYQSVYMSSSETY